MSSKDYGPHQSSIANTDANIVALLAYILPCILTYIPLIGHAAWLIPLIIFLIEKDSQFVKFHSMQAFLLTIVSTIVGFFTHIILIGIIARCLMIVITILALVALFKAYNYKKFEIPVIGNIVNAML